MASISRLKHNGKIYSNLGKAFVRRIGQFVPSISGESSPALKKFPDSRVVIRERYIDPNINDAEDLKKWMAANRPTKKFKIEAKSTSQWTLEDCHITPTSVRWFGLVLACAGYLYYIRTKQKLWMRTDLPQKNNNNNSENKNNNNEETQAQPQAE